MIQPTTLQFDEFRQLLTPRARDAHKGMFGHALIVGGHQGMIGAARLASEAALRVGAGLVSVGTQAESITSIVSERPEIMAHAVKKATDLKPLLKKANVIVLGTGLGQTNWSQQLFKQVLSAPQPKVLDADALNLLAKHARISENWILTPPMRHGEHEVRSKSPCDRGALTGEAGNASRRQVMVVASAWRTPDESGPNISRVMRTNFGNTTAKIFREHSDSLDPGEAARLLDCTIKDIQANRIKAVKALQKQYGGVVVLKGAGSLVCSKQSLRRCSAGNPGMASGGMGDVLSGVIGGLLAQHFNLQQAAECGVYLHAVAADKAASLQGGERGLLASDLMPYLHQLINES